MVDHLPRILWPCHFQTLPLLSAQGKEAKTGNGRVAGSAGGRIMEKTWGFPMVTRKLTHKIGIMLQSQCGISLTLRHNSVGTGAREQMATSRTQSHSFLHVDTASDHKSTAWRASALCLFPSTPSALLPCALYKQYNSPHFVYQRS